MERGPFLVQRQRLTRPHDGVRQMIVGKLDRPEVLMNAGGHFINRHAVGGDRIPDPDEPDLDVLRTSFGG